MSSSAITVHNTKRTSIPLDYLLELLEVTDGIIGEEVQVVFKLKDGSVVRHDIMDGEVHIELVAYDHKSLDEAETNDD